MSRTHHSLHNPIVPLEARKIVISFCARRAVYAVKVKVDDPSLDIVTGGTISDLTLQDIGKARKDENTNSATDTARNGRRNTGENRNH